MPRHPRAAPGGFVYHALNRAVARLPLFQKDEDYRAFERVLAEAMAKHPTRLLGYCIMPNHWHFVLWPEHDNELTAFLRWLTHTHTQRWHAHYQTVGTGHLYQGRFKAFPVQADDHYYTMMRYVERNALRAALVQRAQDWPWCSLAHRGHDSPMARLLHRWPSPTPEPTEWLKYVNGVETEAELEALRKCVQRGQPFGSAIWQQRTAKRVGLEYTMRPRGRPRKTPG